MRNIDTIVIHHSAIPYREGVKQFQSINSAHKNRNWGTKRIPIFADKNKNGNYLQYHYLIEGDGTLMVGATNQEIAWHSGNMKMNIRSFGVCLAGNFEYQTPTESQLRTLDLLLKGKSISNIIGHKDVKATACPGKNLYKLLPKLRLTLNIQKNEWLNFWVNGFRKFFNI